MKISPVDMAFLTLFVSALANPIPDHTSNGIIQTISQINAVVSASALASNSEVALALAQHDEEHLNDLEKRKGGGGRGGGSSSSSGSGRSSVSAPRSSTPKITSSNGKPIISTSTGSRYPGGGSSPYSVGRSAPTRSGMAAPIIVLAAVYYPGFWYYPYPLWYYPYNDKWTFHNATTNANETISVGCVAQQYQESTCDPVNDRDFAAMMLGNGTWNGWNNTMMTVQFIEGVKTAVMNGTAANGTATVSSWGVQSVRAPSAFMTLAGVAITAFMMM